MLTSALSRSCHKSRSTVQLKHQALGQVWLSAVLCCSAMHIDRSFPSAGASAPGGAVQSQCKVTQNNLLWNMGVGQGHCSFTCQCRSCCCRVGSTLNTCCCRCVLHGMQPGEDQCKLADHTFLLVTV